MSNLPLSNQVRPDATLEELKLTKQGWLDMARQAGYPEICWEIVRWLGKKSPSANANYDDVLLLRVEGVSIFGGETVVERRVSSSENCWLFSRHFYVIVKTKDFVPVSISGRDERAAHSIERNNKNEMNQIIFSGEVVMYWEWFLTYDDEDSPVRTEREKTENSDKCFFVNGSWILLLREKIGQAQATKEAHNLANTDLERKRLLGEMLIGVPV